MTHVITDRLEDLCKMLRSLGKQDAAFPIAHGRGDAAKHPVEFDPREDIAFGSTKARDLKIGSGIKVPTRDFR